MTAKKVSTFEVSVEVVPASGQPEERRVTVPATATVREVAEAAGLRNLDGKNLYVDGEPACPDTRVNSASKVEARVVKVTERPQGS